MRITITDSEFEDIIKALEKWNDLVSLLLDKRAAYESSITDKKKGLFNKWLIWFKLIYNYLYFMVDILIYFIYNILNTLKV